MNKGITLGQFADSIAKFEKRLPKIDAQQRGAAAFVQGEPCEAPEGEEFPAAWRKGWRDVAESYRRNEVYRALVDKRREKLRCELQ